MEHATSRFVLKRLERSIAWGAPRAGASTRARAALPGNHGQHRALHRSVRHGDRHHRGVPERSVEAGQASLAVVGPGIAEALVATAVGLLAAIPGDDGLQHLRWPDRRNRLAMLDRFTTQFEEDLSRIVQLEKCSPAGGSHTDRLKGRTLSDGSRWPALLQKRVEEALSSAGDAAPQLTDRAGLEHGRRGNGDINVTPFVDVSVGAADHLHGDRAADAPGHGRQPCPRRRPSRSGCRCAPGADGDEEGRVFPGAQGDSGRRNFKQKLEAVFDARGSKEVFLRADEAAPYGVVVQAMAAARRAGATRLGIVTEEEH